MIWARARKGGLFFYIIIPFFSSLSFLPCINIELLILFLFLFSFSPFSLLFFLLFSFFKYIYNTLLYYDYEITNHGLRLHIHG